jgi:hypothetical protein
MVDSWDGVVVGLAGHVARPVVGSRTAAGGRPLGCL